MKLMHVRWQNRIFRISKLSYLTFTENFYLNVKQKLSIYLSIYLSIMFKVTNMHTHCLSCMYVNIYIFFYIYGIFT